MEPIEIEAIEARLDPSFVMLEWGSGGSTIRFSQSVARLYSIESDAGWFGVVEAEIRTRELANVTLSYVRPNDQRTKPSTYAQFADYIEHAGILAVPRFDAVLIDGRARPQCARFILPFIDRASVVFIHDFYKKGREYYARALADYDVIEPAARTHDNSLVVLRKREDVMSSSARVS